MRVERARSIGGNRGDCHENSKSAPRAARPSLGAIDAQNERVKRAFRQACSSAPGKTANGRRKAEDMSANLKPRNARAGAEKVDASQFNGREQRAMKKK